MKRNYLFLATMLWALIVPTAQASAAEDNILVADNLTAEKGSQIELTISMNNTAEISSFQFDLVLPDNISVVYDEDDEGYAVNLCTTRTTLKKHSIVSDLQEDGSMRIVCTSVSNKTFSGNSGEVVTILLSIGESIASGTHTISLANMELATPDMVKYNPTDYTATITIGGAQTVITFTMTDAGWGTLILPFDAEVPKGLTAYTCEKINDKSELELVDATSLEANTPYIIAGVTGTYEFSGTAANTDKNYTVGLLTGVLEEATAPTGSYVLQKQGDNVAFFKVGDAGKTVNANRCYLNVSSAGATMYRLGGTTSIGTIFADECVDVYDLLGRKITGPLEKGVYIKNNRKFYVR